MSSYQKLFTPLFIFISICIFIAGLVGLQFINRLFAGSKNINGIRIFGFTIIINLIIFVFLIMSFSKVTVSPGYQGPQGNRGDKGFTGKPGGLTVCGNKYQTVQEKKMYEKNLNYLDLKAPLINVE